MRKSLFIAVVLILGLLIARGSKAYAKCEAALARLQAAEAELNLANREYDKASKEYDAAKANMNNAIQNLNAIAAQLGASGQATESSATFGRSPTNPTFYDNPAYKAAKQAWQDAKAALGEAEGKMDEAGQRRKRAQDEYDDAKAEYDKLRAEHIGDEGFLREPTPLELDETLTEEVRKIVAPKLLYDTVNQDDVTSDFGFVLKKVGNKTLLEVSILTKGKGAQFRKWTSEKPKLQISSGILTPVSTSDYYVSKESAMGRVAPLIFAAIGSQYKSEAARAEQSQGKACSASSTTSDVGPVTKATDKAGMAAGLGLLTSHAKGELKGKRATFDVTGREAELKDAKMKVTAVNDEMHKQVDITLPISFNSE